MKQIFTFIGLFFMLNVCNSQNRIDLEQIDFNADISPLLKVEKYFEEKSTVGWKPGYWIYDMEKFRFGDILLTSGGERGPNDPGARNKIELTMDTARTHLITVNIIIEKSEEARHLLDYVHNRYGKPITLKEDPKPNRNSEIMGYGGELWKDIAPGRSLLLAKAYTKKDKKPAFSVILHIIKSDDPEIFMIDYDGNKLNVLEYLVLRHSDYRDVIEVRKELQKISK